MNKHSLRVSIGNVILLAALTSFVLIFPSTGQANYSLSEDIYTVGSNPAGLALDPSNNPIGGVPIISWTFTAPSAGPALLSILAEGVDTGELDEVFFNSVSIGFLTQQGFYSSFFNLQPGPGALPGITAETTSFFDVFANAGLNTVQVDVAPGRWVDEIETSNLSSIPEPGTLGLVSFGLVVAGIARRNGTKRS